MTTVFQNSTHFTETIRTTCLSTIDTADKAAFSNDMWQQLNDQYRQYAGSLHVKMKMVDESKLKDHPYGFWVRFGKVKSYDPVSRTFEYAWIMDYYIDTVQRECEGGAIHVTLKQF